MALLAVSVQLHTLDNDVLNQISDTSPIRTLLAAFRTLAVDALPLVDDMASLDGQSRLQLTCEVGTPQIESQNTTGSITWKVCAVIDDELANHVLESGPAAAFTTHIIEGIGPVIENMPGRDDFLTQIGVGTIEDLPDHLHVVGWVTLYG